MKIKIINVDFTDEEKIFLGNHHEIVIDILLKIVKASEKMNIKQCPSCHQSKEYHLWPYNEEFDSYYCPNCLIWLEEKCSDPDCYFCPTRPDKPTHLSFIE